MGLKIQVPGNILHQTIGAFKQSDVRSLSHAHRQNRNEIITDKRMR